MKLKVLLPGLLTLKNYLPSDVIWVGTT